MENQLLRQDSVHGGPPGPDEFFAFKTPMEIMGPVLEQQDPSNNFPGLNGGNYPTKRPLKMGPGSGTGLNI